MWRVESFYRTHWPYAGNRMMATFYHPWFRESVFCWVAYWPREAWWRMCIITWWDLDMSASWKIVVPSCVGDFIPRRNTSINCRQKLSEMWLPWPKRFEAVKCECCDRHVCWRWNWMHNLHNILHHTAFVLFPFPCIMYSVPCYLFPCFMIPWFFYFGLSSLIHFLPLSLAPLLEYFIH